MSPLLTASRTANPLRLVTSLRCAGFVLATAWLFVGGEVARAQDAPPSPPAGSEMAAFVPETAGVYVQLDHLPELIRQQQNRTLWIELLRWGGDEGSWQRALAETLGMRSESAIQRLFRNRVAFAAPAWRRLDEGVLLFSDGEPRAVQILLGPEAAKPPEERLVFQTASGLWVARLKSTVVLARQRGEGSLFDGCVELLDGKGAPLANREDFKRRLGRLPSPSDGCAYWSAPAEQPGEDPPGWWPPRHEGAISLRVEAQRLQITLTSAAPATETDQSQPRILYDRLAGLPQSTLLASSRAINVGEWFEFIYNVPPPPELEPLWAKVEAHLDAEKFEEDIIANLGPRCVVFVSADFTREDFAPQLGLLLESLDSATVVAALHDRAQRLVEALAPPDAAANVSVTTSEYLDITIHSLAWERRDSGDAPYSLADLLVEHVRPAIAAVDGWVVLASSPSLIEQIVDARRGLAPSLGDVTHLSAHMPQLRRAVRAMVAQPGLAQGTLRTWDNVLRARRREAESRGRLGITASTEHTAGQVVVVEVNSNGPSADLLQLGDGIIACNGVLLAMETPNESLRRLIGRLPLKEPLRLRVRRGEELVEVAIPGKDGEEEPQPTVVSALLSHLAPLERLAAQVASAVYAVERPSAEGSDARLMLEFVRSRRATRAGSSAANEPPPPE